MIWVSRLAAVCFIVALPLLLITASVRFFAGEVRFYERGFRDHQAAARTGIALPELDRAAAELVRYFEDDADTVRILVNEGGQEASLFNTRETEHMREVKRLMRVIFRVNEVTLAYCMAYVSGVFLWSGERPLRSLAKQGLAGIGVGLTAVGAIGAAAATGFDAAWTQFHEILFRNDLWRLNPDTDHLIQMFPEGFWQDATFIVAGLVLAQAAIIIIGAVGVLLFYRERTEDPERKPRPIRARRLRTAR